MNVLWIALLALLAAGALGTRHSPRPLCEEGRRCLENSRANDAAARESMFGIPPSSRALRSNPAFLLRRDWIASLALAMTVMLR